MGQYVLLPISEKALRNQTIVDMGLGMVGLGSEDKYLCGHCNAQVIQGMNMDGFGEDVVFRCGHCQGFNLPPLK